MAHNPFLSLEENVVAPVEIDTFNPFMVGGAADVPTCLDGDNPFAASNPFSDFGSYEQSGSNAVPMDIFGVDNNYGSSYSQGPLEIITQKNSHINIFDTPAVEFIENPRNNISKPTNLDLNVGENEIQSTYSSDEDIQKPKRPPPPARPLPPETQNLILSVTGHMDFTSSHLLDRIPPTRTPSPVSMRDLHSPSPTPDYPFDESEDVLEESLIDANTAPVQQIHTDTETPPVTNDFFNPENTSTQVVFTAQNDESVQNNMLGISVNIKPPTKPARPVPPARPQPPPIPAEPVRASAPSPTPMPVPPPTPAPEVQQPTTIFDDEVNLFDPPVASRPPTKPTKEDILSLYAAPKQEKRIDFLSDDIIEEVCTTMKEPQINSTLIAPPVEVTILPEDTIKMDSAIEKDMIPAQNLPRTEVDAGIPQFVADDLFSTVVQEEDVTNPFEVSPDHKFSGNQDTTSVFGMPNAISGSHAFDIPNIAAGVTTFDTSVTETPVSIFDMPVTNTEVGDFDVTISKSEVSASVAPKPINIIAAPALAAMAIPGPENSPYDNSTEPEEFDAFSQKFNSICNGSASSGAWGDKTSTADAFGAFGENPSNDDAFVAFGASASGSGDGFEAEGDFDASPFLGVGEAPPPPSVTPAYFSKEDSLESDDANFSVFIKPKADNLGFGDASSSAPGLSGVEASVPVLAPPPRPAALFSTASSATAHSPSPSPGFDPRVNPFDTAAAQPFEAMEFGSTGQNPVEGERRSGSESPATPLFDDDVSMPLEDFPRIQYTGPGWEMQLRQPNKKKITGQRFWKKIFVKLAYQGDNPVVQLYNAATDKEPFQELPLQACYSASEVGAQQYDQFGKIFTVKLQYIFYKERPGVRPGQVTKAERITNKLSQFAAYAIQGDYQGVKEFGSDLKKLGLPVEHAPQISQLFKIGSLVYEDVKQFSVCVEEALFRLHAHRDRALVYKMEEVQITAVDELYVEQDAEGSIIKQIARVRLFFLGFLSGMPDIELGVNDMRRQGREVVGRHDIIPVATEEWIRLEVCEFHACVQPEEFHATKIIKFKPPDACYIELMRFRVRPPKNRELPLQLKAVMCVTGTKVELRADVLVPGFASRKLGQVPCEDVMIRFPIPECWIYLFRVEKHFRYGSVKSAHKRTGKIKGIERFLGAAAVDTLQESLIEVTSGQAKYEHQHRAIVWRMPRLPKEGQGAYTTHNLVCRMALTSYDQIPSELAHWAYVEFTMPATQVSHTTVRSVSLQNHDSDDPPEKYVRYLARHEYKVGIEHTQGSSTGAYTAAAATVPRPVTAQPAPQAKPAVPQPPSSDSDSD